MHDDDRFEKNTEDVVQVSPEITFRNIGSSDALRDAIESRIDKLHHYNDRLMACRVAFERRNNSRRNGDHYHCRVDLTLPGKEIVVGRDPADKDAHVDPYIAIRDAFDAAERQLKEVGRQRHPGVHGEGRPGKDFRVPAD